MYNIILPTYNEKENIKILVPMINQYFLSIDTVYKIIVVDDNSPDGTADEIEKLMKKYPIELIKRKGKEGLGTAYIAAIEYCKFDYIIIMDADMSHDPIYILEFIGLQQKRSCDIVLSTRYSKGGGVTGWSFKRKLISRTANNLASIVLNLNISDLTGSFRLYKRNVLINLLNEVYSCGYSIQMELAFYASKSKYRIEECPIIFYDRFNGVSKCGITEIFLFLKVILLLFCRC